MLILTRRIGQTLRIGDDVQIIVINADKHKARLGIAAPKVIPVYREEIYERIKKGEPKPDKTGEVG